MTTDWIQTYTGKAFRPRDPNPADIDILDIAHALSMQCRYGGHARFHYSVAQHSVLVSRSVPDKFALHGLLHDASEAYLVDIPRPIKVHMVDYLVMEAHLEMTIFERFGLPLKIPKQVKDIDNRILVDEREQLMATPPMPWGDPMKPVGVTIDQWSPEKARNEFMMRFSELSS